MNWVAIVLIVLGVWLALKVASALVKLMLWTVALLAVWWFIHPYLGLPLFPF